MSEGPAELHRRAQEMQERARSDQRGAYNATTSAKWHSESGDNSRAMHDEQEASRLSAEADTYEKQAIKFEQQARALEQQISEIDKQITDLTNKRRTLEGGRPGLI